MDERWLKALQAKNMTVRGMPAGADDHAGRERNGGNNSDVRRAAGSSTRRAQPFKATGHKGGISRQGS
ncbi:hypothetical protein [Bifidobacterium leontopitheci]|nr:hypothetical protein [Bifidobacterium leontopitheci]